MHVSHHYHRHHHGSSGIRHTHTHVSYRIRCVFFVPRTEDEPQRIVTTETINQFHYTRLIPETSEVTVRYLPSFPWIRQIELW